MSYCKHPLGAVPEGTARVAKRSLKGKARRFIVLADEVDGLFSEFAEALAASYPDAGQWGIHPFRIIALLLLQAMEGLTDRQAAEAVALNIGWKLVLRLPLEHEGWDASVLSRGRERLLESVVLKTLFDAMLLRAREKGYLSTVQQRTDSTTIEACVHSLNRTELVLETFRNALEELTEEDHDFIAKIRQEHWLKRYYLERPFNYRLPQKESQRTKLAEAAGQDGFYLLQCIAKCPKKQRERLEALESIVTLKRVLDEQFTKDKGGRPKFRQGKELKPSGERLASPFEPDARKSSKGDTHWTGYKCHITETCVKGFPNLITDVQTTVGTENDSETLPAIIQSLVNRALKPVKLLVDGGYVNVEVLTAAKEEHAIDVVTRLTNLKSWQGKEGWGFDQSGFDIDWKRRVAICPAGFTSTKWTRTKDEGSVACFSAEDCLNCPFKSDCTKGQFRVLHVKKKSVWDHMQMMKTRQTKPEFQKQYAVRAGVEGTQSEFIQTAGRRSSVRGKTKTHQKMLLAVLAVNFSRLFHWSSGRAPSKTRRGKFESAFAVA